MVGLSASAVISTVLLESFLNKRYTRSLENSATHVQQVVSLGPQTANAEQVAALIGSPLGIIGVDSRNKVVLATTAVTGVANDLARITDNAPPGQVIAYHGADGSGELRAIRVSSPGLTVTSIKTPRPIRPVALILTVDTSVDESTIHTLIARQLTLVTSALLLLLGLAVLVLRIGMKPLERMAWTADAIADGSLKERLPLRGDDSETDRLAKAVNRAFDAQARAEAAVRSLAADTSHELRTPLSTISGWLDLHRQGGLSGPHLHNALGHIENEVGRMRLLVEDLSLLARLDAGRPVERDAVDIHAVASGVIDDAQVIYPDRKITLTGIGPTRVAGDSARLQQVLRNLVGNAIQHTPPQTAVRVDVTTEPDDAIVRVMDDGPGIAEQDLPKVFERFWRAEASRSREYGGSGLGLAIVEAIVHAHQGRVSVESVVGRGTTVTVFLPRAADSPPPNPAAI
ncbi:sensor histidine kinase [Streptomyces sp. NPDC048179]|uniref:sensor histidine kinase n=1 Tax=Streptomyces sp. NPDC048179 TaxID=3365506 RepID=UPI0037194C0E